MNKNWISLPTKRSFLKVSFNLVQIAKNYQTSLEHNYRVQEVGPQSAIYETVSKLSFF